MEKLIRMVTLSNFMELSSQEITWLIEELNIMIDESLSSECPRSQFSVNTMRSLLAKLKQYEGNI